MHSKMAMSFEIVRVNTSQLMTRNCVILIFHVFFSLQLRLVQIALHNGLMVDALDCIEIWVQAHCIALHITNS